MNRYLLAPTALFLLTLPARAQIRVELKFARLQYIAHEPILATVSITNLAGRDIDLADEVGQQWYGFELTGEGDRLLAPLIHEPEAPLHLAAGATVVRKINLTDRFPVGDLGTYHVRANVYFADLKKFFYSRGRVFEVTGARPIWQQTVGTPEDGTRTYSLMTNRFPDHTSLYVRVEDKSNGLIFATYSLGRTIAFDQPHAEIDRENHLHVLHCSAPRLWSYSVVGLDGKLISHAAYAQTHSTPRLVRSGDGKVSVTGGVVDLSTAPKAAGSIPKLSDRPVNLPPEK